MIKAFPFTKNKLSQIRDLVNRVKSKDEDPIKFYYDKLDIGMSCNMSDEVIAQAIIGILDDKFFEIGALSAGSYDTSSLLKYLASMQTSTDYTELKPHVRPHFQGNSSKIIKSCTRGKVSHKARMCGKLPEKRKDERKCTFCERLLFSSITLNENVYYLEENYFSKRNQAKHCAFCNFKGHTQDECRKRRTGQDRTENSNS